jgi:hypothetical protein
MTYYLTTLYQLQDIFYSNGSQIQEITMGWMLTGMTKTKLKAKAVALHATKALAGEEV